MLHFTGAQWLGRLAREAQSAKFVITTYDMLAVRARRGSVRRARTQTHAAPRRVQGARGHKRRMRNATDFKRVAWGAFLLDEAHIARNADTARHKARARVYRVGVRVNLRARPGVQALLEVMNAHPDAARLCVTGTPLNNR